MRIKQLPNPAPRYHFIRGGPGLRGEREPFIRAESSPRYHFSKRFGANRRGLFICAL